MAKLKVVLHFTSLEARIIRGYCHWKVTGCFFCYLNSGADISMMLCFFSSFSHQVLGYAAAFVSASVYFGIGLSLLLAFLSLSSVLICSFLCPLSVPSDAVLFRPCFSYLSSTNIFVMHPLIFLIPLSHVLFPTTSFPVFYF